MCSTCALNSKSNHIISVNYAPILKMVLHGIVMIIDIVQITIHSSQDEINKWSTWILKIVFFKCWAPWNIFMIWSSNIFLAIYLVCDTSDEQIYPYLWINFSSCYFIFLFIYLFLVSLTLSIMRRHSNYVNESYQSNDMQLS